MATQIDAGRRRPLNRERVLRAAVALADGAGSTRSACAGSRQELGVVPMALYKHVANKEELLDGMVDVVVGEIDPRDPTPTGRPPSASGSCRRASALLRHPWASRVMESRTEPTPTVMATWTR